MYYMLYVEFMFINKKDAVNWNVISRPLPHPTKSRVTAAGKSLILLTNRGRCSPLQLQLVLSRVFLYSLRARPSFVIENDHESVIIVSSDSK